MPSNDPVNSADMRRVYISEARCSSHLLHVSKRYRLLFSIQSPATVTGLRSLKSHYIKATHEGVTWKDPFGDEFMVTSGPIDCTMDLSEHRFGRSARIVASCTLDLSLKDREICLDLKGHANKKFGELAICVASPLPSTSEAVETANQAAQQLGPRLPMVNDAIQAATPLATEIAGQFNAWQPLLGRLGALVKVADTVAEIHPWIKLVWGVVSAAYRIPSAQSDRDAKVMGLVQTMADTCSFADEGEELNERSKKDQDIINQILRQVMECAYFIRDYCRDKSFAKRTVKYTVSLVDARIDNYKGTLETLRRNLIDRANIECSVITHRVLDVVTEVRDLQVLSELNYTSKAHHDLDKGCLDGTRTEIIDAIVRWALGADTPSSDLSNSVTLSSNESSRVLWLCGVAGAGKSSILRSCAQRISELERKGSYYGFDKNQPLANLTNLFSTIARDLADLDNSRKQRLLDAVKNETAIRTTDSCKLQFQHFIVASFKDDKAVGETIVFIDAFDESGDVAARADALAILTKRASEFPLGLRVVVTSRYERDIQDALQSPLPAGVEIMLVDDIPRHQTSRDIATYIRNELDVMNVLRETKYKTQVNALIQKAGISFQWAATACRFIRPRYAGVDPQDQIRKMLQADIGLYGLYGIVMREHCDPSDEKAVQRVKSILGRIITAREPLPFHALVHLVPSDSILTPNDREIHRGIVKHLASLLSGTHNDREPIVPLHSSYRDFLCNAEHNKDFYIDEGQANQSMALACFHLMEESLKFNICEFPTSFLRNVDVPDIKGLREKHIPYHLYYACRFWGSHVSETSSGEFARKHLESFFHKDFLPWLEVMSLTQSSPQIALASLSPSHIAVDLIEEQEDAVQFVSMFANAIATSVPHIYLSGLTFAPTSSLLYQRWHGQFPGVAKLVQGQLQHWPKMMLRLEGHHEAVRSVAFSPNGRQIASGSQDKTIQLWNVETGATIGQAMKGHHHAIVCIAFSPDGKQIASGSRDKTIQLWSVETGESIGQPMKGHHDTISSIAFSPDGKQIASGSLDETIQLWSVETGASIGQPMKGHCDSIYSIAFSPDGKQIASGSRDKTIQLWSVEMGESIGQPMKGHHGSIYSIAFSPDGKQIASGSNENTIQLWNVETGASIGQPIEGHHGSIYSIAFSPDGKQIASGSRDKTIQLWNVETGARIGQPMEGHHGSIRSIAFSPDGKQIASGSDDKTIQLWNVEIGASIGQPMQGHDHFIQSIDFSPDGKQIASGFQDNTTQLQNVETEANISQPIQGHHGSICSIAFSPDGKQIVSGSQDNTIQHWSMETGASIGQPKEGHHHSILSISFSPDGKQSASGSLDNTIQLWNVETGASIGQKMKGHHGPIYSITFSPNGKQIASGSQDKTMQLWDVETGESIGQPMEGHHGSIYSIAFSPDGKQIASGSQDTTIQLWNVETGASIGQPMEGHHGSVYYIAFSPNGKQIASGSDDTTIQLWNVETGATIGQPMEGHYGSIYSIAFSPDGKQIASGSQDNTLQLWNVETRARIGQPMGGHHGSIWSLAFSPDGQQIASGSWDGTIQLWNIATGTGTGQPMQGYDNIISPISFSPDGNQIPSSLKDHTIKISSSPSAESKHTLQYPVHLFPLPPSPFQLDDGWILGPNHELILWVPPAYHASLEHPHCHIMGNPNNTQIDFHPLKCGKEWAQNCLVE